MPATAAPPAAEAAALCLPSTADQTFSSLVRQSTRGMPHPNGRCVRSAKSAVHTSITNSWPPASTSCQQEPSTKTTGESAALHFYQPRPGALSMSPA